MGASLGTWSDYENLKSTQKREILEESRLVDLASLHQSRHNGADGLKVEIAYAQNHKVYRNGRISAVDDLEYVTINDPNQRVNKFDAFGPAYRKEARTLWLDERLANVTSDAAKWLGERGYTLIAFDGLRTMEAGYLMAAANPESVDIGLLARPGRSAHNRGLAIDAMLLDSSGCEADMGGHFDHVDYDRANKLESSHRNYRGIEPRQYANRLLMERAFMRAALKNNTLIAPLREEFWDFRAPEDRMDLWRVLESVARCIDDHMLQQQIGEVIDGIRTLNREGRQTEAVARFGFRSYDDFKHTWKELFRGKDVLLMQALGTTQPPASEAGIAYHGAYNPIYDRELPSEQRLVNEALFAQIKKNQGKQQMARA